MGRQQARVLRRLWWAAMVGNVVGLVWVTWVPVADDGSAGWWPAWLGEMSLQLHYAMNLLLLVPTALLVRWRWRRLAVWQVGLVCLAVSGVIELGQFLVPTRVPDVVDVLANTAGGVAAAFLAAYYLPADRTFRNAKPPVLG